MEHFVEGCFVAIRFVEGRFVAELFFTSTVRIIDSISFWGETEKFSNFYTEEHSSKTYFSLLQKSLHFLWVPLR
jgi:hypothetical protein